MNLQRLWEKITGQEHQQRESALVIAEARELSSMTRELNERLAHYHDAPDAFMAMWADAYEARQEASIWKGDGK